MATNYDNKSQNLEAKMEEWDDIENLVLDYKIQFEKENVSDEEKIKADNAALQLITRFNPLFKKYITLLKTGQIDFKDADIKTFVGTFIDDPRLHRALKRKKSRAEYRSDIYKKFNFVLETYGQVPEEDMLVDMQMLLLILAKRYKQMGKNFCAYVHNCFRYEVSRHIKKYIKNPINISYNNITYIDADNGSNDSDLNMIYEDLYYEPENGIPNASWINGNTCSDIFNCLSPLERKIIVKYYIEEFNDKQIADMLALHINTVNQKRRQAIMKIAKESNIDVESIKRNRHSGRKQS